MIYSSINPVQGTNSGRIVDTWGYTYNAYYTVYMIDKTETYRAAVRDFVQHRCRGLDAEHEPPFLGISPLSDARNHELARRLSGLAQTCEAPGQLTGVPYGTDAPAFDAIGIPTVVFGPGSIAQAHTDDEWVAIDQLRTSAEVYYALAKQGLDRKPV